MTAVRADARTSQDEFEGKLVSRVLGYVRQADIGEDARRRHDRLGARIYYAQHYSRDMPPDRAQIVANLAGAIIRHKVSIMVKQDPICVVEPDDVGDEKSAQRMNGVLQRVWKTTGMREKIRRLVTLANCTRTAALKVVWDPIGNSGAGKIDTDVIEGWNLILDDRVSAPGAMQYAGQRASMARSMAMLNYPDAADKIAELTESSAFRKTGPLGARGSPITNPWKTSYLPPPGAAIVNGKAVVTAFAGEIVNQDSNEDVDVIEMYHRDHTYVEREVPVRDTVGAVKQEIVRDEHGMPQFEEGEPELHQLTTGEHLRLPRFNLKTQDVMERRLVRKYPHWRRTTICVFGMAGALLEDRAWDLPLPFSFYTDLEPLSGIIGRGSLLQTETLQALVNVTLSSTTDSVRFGQMNAWLAGTQSGVTQTQIIPSIGQVIPVRSVGEFEPIKANPVDQSVFTLIDKAVGYMERILGATGVMQGEASGRVDSAAGYDTLAEIGGSTLVECTQRLETTIAKWAQIAGAFAQRYYDERYAVRIEDEQGRPAWERANTALLAGSFSYETAPGSTMAWSESAKQGRAFQEYSARLIDKQEYYERTKTPNWRQVLARMVAVEGPQAAMPPIAARPAHGAAGAQKQSAAKKGTPR